MRGSGRPYAVELMHSAKATLSKSSLVADCFIAVVSYELSSVEICGIRGTLRKLHGADG